MLVRWALKKAMGWNVCSLVSFNSLIFALFSLCQFKWINIYFDKTFVVWLHSVCGQLLPWTLKFFLLHAPEDIVISFKCNYPSTFHDPASNLINVLFSLKWFSVLHFYITHYSAKIIKGWSDAYKVNMILTDAVSSKKFLHMILFLMVTNIRCFFPSFRHSCLPKYLIIF